MIRRGALGIWGQAGSRCKANAAKITPHGKLLFLLLSPPGRYPRNSVNADPGCGACFLEGGQSD